MKWVLFWVSRDCLKSTATDDRAIYLPKTLHHCALATVWPPGDERASPPEKTVPVSDRRSQSSVTKKPEIVSD